MPHLVSEATQSLILSQPHSSSSAPLHLSLQVTHFEPLLGQPALKLLQFLPARTCPQALPPWPAPNQVQCRWCHHPKKLGVPVALKCLCFCHHHHHHFPHDWQQVLPCGLSPHLSLQPSTTCSTWSSFITILGWDGDWNLFLPEPEPAVGAPAVLHITKSRSWEKYIKKCVPCPFPATFWMRKG